MKRIYLLVLLVVLLSGCRRNPTSSTNTQRVAFAQFSPDGKRIVTASKEAGKMRIWDTQTGQEFSSTNGMLVWDLSKGSHVLPRYEAGTPDNMPIVGGDYFKVLQDQIDSLEKRVRELETKTGKTGK